MSSLPLKSHLYFSLLFFWSFWIDRRKVKLERSMFCLPYFITRVCCCTGSGHCVHMCVTNRLSYPYKPTNQYCTDTHSYSRLQAAHLYWLVIRLWTVWGEGVKWESSRWRRWWCWWSWWTGPSWLSLKRRRSSTEGSWLDLWTLIIIR